MHDGDNTDDIKEIEDEGETWFWHERANESESDTEDGGYSDLGGGNSGTKRHHAPQNNRKEYIGIRKEKITWESFMERGHWRL